MNLFDFINLIDEYRDFPEESLRKVTVEVKVDNCVRGIKSVSLEIDGSMSPKFHINTL